MRGKEKGRKEGDIEGGMKEGGAGEINKGEEKKKR